MADTAKVNFTPFYNGFLKTERTVNVIFLS